MISSTRLHPQTGWRSITTIACAFALTACQNGDYPSNQTVTPVVAQPPALTPSLQPDAPAPPASLELTLDGPRGDSVRFSDDGKRLLVTGKTEMQVWDTATWKPIGPRIERDGYLVEIDRSCSRVLVQQGTKDERISTVLDVATGQRIGYSVWQSERGFAGMRLSTDGALVARLIDDGVIQLWHADTGEVYRSFSPTPPGRPRKATDEAFPFETNEIVQRVEFDPDGSSLNIAGHRGSTGVWNYRTGELRFAKQFTHNHVEDMSAKGRVLLSGIGGFEVQDLASGKVLLQRSGYDKYEFQAVQISADGTRAAVYVLGIETGTEIWDVDAARRMCTIADSSSVAFDPQGDTVAVRGAEHAGVWDIANGQLIRTFAGREYISEAAYSPNGNQLAVTCRKFTKVLFARPGVTGAERWRDRR